MEQIHKIILLFAIFSCKAQSIHNLETLDHYGKPNFYYKDVNNLFNNYEGTWIFNNGTTIFTIKLRKVVNYFDSDGNYYEDALIGEYEYSENGIIKVSTLNMFNNNISPAYHNIKNSLILKKFQPPLCNECDSTIKRISIFFDDPDREYLEYRGYIGLTTDSSPKLVFHLVDDGWLFVPEGAPVDRRVISGHYILTKQ